MITKLFTVKGLLKYPDVLLQLPRKPIRFVLNRWIFWIIVYILFFSCRSKLASSIHSERLCMRQNHSVHFIMWLFLESSCRIVKSSGDVLYNDILSSTLPCRVVPLTFLKLFFFFVIRSVHHLYFRPGFALSQSFIEWIKHNNLKVYVQFLV